MRRCQKGQSLIRRALLATFKMTIPDGPDHKKKESKHIEEKTKDH